MSDGFLRNVQLLRHKFIDQSVVQCCCHACLVFEALISHLSSSSAMRFDGCEILATPSKQVTSFIEMALVAEGRMVACHVTGGQLLTLKI